MTASRSSWVYRLRPRVGLLALALLLGTLALLAGMGLLAYSGWFISATALAGATGAGALAFDIFRPGAIIRAFAVVRTAARYGERLVSHDAVLHLLADLRNAAFRKLARLAPEPLAQRAEGELLQRVVGDIDTLDEGPLRVLLPLFWATLVVAVASLLITLAAPTLFPVAAPWLIAAALIVPLVTARQAWLANRRLAALAGRHRELAVDQLRGLTTLLLCGAWKGRREDWTALDRELVDRRLRQRMIDAAGLAIVMLCIGIAAWTVLSRGEALLVANELALPLLAMAVLGSLATLEALAPAASAMQAWARTSAANQRLEELLVQGETIRFVDFARVERVDHATLWMLDAAYHYPSSLMEDTPRGLDATTLRVEPGSRIVLTGPSGSGKSTFAALLARIVDPQSGLILFGNQDLCQVSESSLRSTIALLTQRPHLFALTLAENLRFGDLSADDARLLAALDAVALGDFIRSLPRGLATPIGEYGVGLSGGEARRVALARTLLRGAALVILDEPFEGLDDATRQRVVAGINQWVGDGTLIVISHHTLDFGVRTRRLRIEAGRLLSDSA
ncbi:MAG: thiol reductant ABC exporter subunit CydC [Dokdonella sp.]